MSYKNKGIYTDTQSKNLFQLNYNDSIKNERTLRNYMVYIEAYYPNTYARVHYLSNETSCKVSSNYTQFKDGILITSMPK